MSPAREPPYGSCLVVRDRILARAALYHTERSNTRQLVVEPMWVSRWLRTVTLSITRPARNFSRFSIKNTTATALTSKTVTARREAS
jgi:hypothetical protein